MPRAYIAGTGHYAPPNVVTNQDLVDKFKIDTTNEWIVQRTGIEQRHFAGDGVGPSDLGYEATQMALSRAGLTAADVDFIVFATLSPEHAFPGSGCYLQAKLGIPGVPAMDIRNQCSGFLYALAAAKGLVETGMSKTCLVVGGERHSSGLDLTTEGRQIACLFGDGAGAVVLRATSDEDFEKGRGIRWMNLGADGRFADALSQKVWDNRHAPFIPKDPVTGKGIVEKEKLWCQMDGKQVFKNAVEKMILSVMGMCMENQIEPADLDLVVCHQANLRINEYVRDQLGLSPEKVPNNIQRYGNTTAATIPILLSELEADGRLKRGMKVALVAFGSGFTWGSAYVVW
ncbi:MAG: ketoacyl-ACP synthase III [Deltaproteobacteria bacterium]|nr:ketoacyl-ACP synthase III [Deltaproteobacteria bacterium]